MDLPGRVVVGGRYGKSPFLVRPGGVGPLRIEWHCFVSVSGFLAWLGWQNKEGFMQDKSALFHLMRNS